jgi:DNA-binding beta-propeller fold protein YncE
MRFVPCVVLVVSKLVATACGADLFWNDDAGIHRLRGAAHVPPAVLFETFQTRGIAVDPAHDRLWWSDVLPLGSPLPGGVIRTGSIRRGPITNVVTHLTEPAGIALDSRGGRVYWSDLGDATHPSAIYSANLDGSDVQQLISGPSLSEIAGIALDLSHDKLYFTYVNPLVDSLLPGGIGRTDLDGSNLEPIVGGLGKPIGIAVDPAGGGIYWADARSLSPAGGSGVIQAAELDGDNVRTILGGLNVPYGAALDLAHQNVYWTDRETGKIQLTAMSGVLPFFQDAIRGLSAPTAIAIVPEPAGVAQMLLAISTIIAFWALARRLVF